MLYKIYDRISYSKEARTSKCVTFLLEMTEMIIKVVGKQFSF